MTILSVSASDTAIGMATPPSAPVPLSRRHFTRQRRALTKQQRRLAATLASTHLHKLSAQLPKQAKVGLYFDDFGELPTQPIVDWLLRSGYLGYLPVVGSLGRDNKVMRFAAINRPRLSQLPNVRHSLGMKQISSRKLLWADELDLIFCPLVVADLFGNRMGMGGGFYDSTLTKVSRIGNHRTLIIGWCYDFQVVEKLQRQPWDVPLDGLITPNTLRWF